MGSAAAVAWAFGQRTGSASAKAVLLALAYYAAAGLCRAPVRELAQLTDQGEEAVRVALDVLEARGLIRREKHEGVTGNVSLVVTLPLPGGAL
ncbi:MAG: hypothetical protein Kow00114_32870 [Kiloniellaceae bacterium]